MPEVIRTSRDATDAPLHEVRDTLRPVALPTGTLRVEQPERRVIPTAPPVPLSARFHPDVYGPVDRYDGHHADRAFGEGDETARIPGQRQASDYRSAA